MYNFFRQNRNIVLVAIGVFIVSMTALLFFLNNEGQGAAELKTDVIDSFMLKSNQVKEKNYRELLQNHEDPIVVIGLDGTVEFASWDFETSTGLSPEEVEDELFFEYLNPEDLGTFLSAFGKVIETGRPVNMIGPFRIRDEDGEYHLNMGSVYPVVENGKVVKIGITTKDITNEVNEAGNTGTTLPKKKIVPKKAPTGVSSTATKSDPPAKESEAPKPVRWKPKNYLKNDPGWITAGEKLVMLLPAPFNFRIQLFPARLLLARL